MNIISTKALPRKSRIKQNAAYSYLCSLIVLLLFCVVAGEKADCDSSSRRANELTSQAISTYETEITDEGVQKAIGLLRAAVQEDPQFVVAHYWLALVLTESRNWESSKPEAIKEFSKVIELEKKNGETEWSPRAKAKLRSLMGRQPLIAFIPCIDAKAADHYKASSKEWQEVAGEVAEGIRIHLPSPYRGIDFPSPYENTPNLQQICETSDDKNIGWAAIVRVKSFANAVRSELRKPNARGITSGFCPNKTLEVELELFDPSASRRVVKWSAVNDSPDDELYESSYLARKAAVAFCVKDIRERMLELIKEEDDFAKSDLNVLSLPTKLEDIYKKAGTKDRALAKALPVLLVFNTRNDSQNPEGKYVGEGLEKIDRLILKEALASLRVSIIPPQELNKLGDSTNTGSDDGAALRIARKFGNECAWVVRPTISGFEVKMSKRDLGLTRAATAKLQLHCRLLNVRTGESIDLPVKKASYRSESIPTNEGAPDDSKISALNHAVKQAVQELVPEIIARTAGH